MKQLFCFFICILFSGSCIAQSIEDNDNIIGIGIGLGGFYKASDEFNSESPTLGIIYERALPLEWERSVISVGGYAGVRSLVSKNSTGFLYYDKHYTFVIAGLRAAYHYNEWFRSYDLDSYAGLMYSYNVLSIPDKNDFPNGVGTKKHSGTGPSIYGGLRYYLDKSWAVYAEVGFGLSYLTLGACAKF